MVDFTMSQQRIPRNLLDDYSTQVWFGVSHKKTYIRIACVLESTFKMRSLKFQIDEQDFHAEVRSWPGVAMEIRSGVYIYSFDGMLPDPLLGETSEEAMARMSRLQLTPIIEQLNTKV